MNLKDFEKCLKSTHAGKPCGNKPCVAEISNKEYHQLIELAKREGKKWQ